MKTDTKRTLIITFVALIFIFTVATVKMIAATRTTKDASNTSYGIDNNEDNLNQNNESTISGILEDGMSKLDNAGFKNDIVLTADKDTIIYNKESNTIRFTANVNLTVDSLELVNANDNSSRAKLRFVKSLDDYSVYECNYDIDNDAIPDENIYLYFYAQYKDSNGTHISNNVQILVNKGTQI